MLHVFFFFLLHGNQFANQCSVRKSVAKLFGSLCLNLRDGGIVADCGARQFGVDLCFKGGSEGGEERDITFEK